MVPYLTSSSQNSSFYDLTYQISNTVEINLVEGLEEDGEITFQTFPILTYDGERKYGKGLEILERQDFDHRKLVREAPIRVGIPIFEILRRENKRAYDQLVPLNEKLSNQGLANTIFGRYGYYGSCIDDKKQFTGMLNFLTIDGDSFEKIISCMGMDFLYNNITSKQISVKNGSKINQVLGVPKSIIPRIRDEFSKEMDAFQTICQILNGNDAVYLLEFLDAVFKPGDNESDAKNMRKVIRTIAEIEALRKTAMPTLLTYLFRQTYYGSFMYEGSVVDAGCGEFLYLVRFLDTCIVLRDTLNMHKNMTEMVPNDLPADLFYEHQVLAENKKSVSDKGLTQEFNEAVTDYSRLNLAGEDFEIRAPENIQELVAEGTVLRHCVASYKERIANRQSIIMFVRRKTHPKEPFVTVEYDPELGVVQVKEKFDKDVIDPEVLRFVRTWEKGVKL